MKHSLTNSFNLFFSFEKGIVVLRVEKSNVLMLLKEENVCTLTDLSLRSYHCDIAFLVLV